jgi:acyl-CoA thioester hydrolase
VRIRFQDCDPFGHLYNARYLDYFINAREDHLAEHCGLDIYERQRTLNKNWLITKHEIAYISPANLRETVVIKTCLLTFTEDSLLMEGVMSDETERHLKAVLWTRFRYFCFKSLKTSKHSPDLMTLFGAIALLKTRTPDRFDYRVTELRKGYQMRSLSQPTSATDSEKMGQCKL